MTQFKNLMAHYVSDTNGATAIEYGLIAALIAVAIISGAKAMSGSVNSLFTDVDSELVKSLDK